MYENKQFEVTLRHDDDGSGVQIKHHGAIVLQVRWQTPLAGPGRVFVEPGAWRAELMGLQAEHA